MKRSVVISGLGVVSPIGNDKEELWNSIENGKCGMTDELQFHIFLDFMASFDCLFREFQVNIR